MYEKKIINFLKDYKKSVNWVFFIDLLIMFNAVFLASDWTIKGFIVLNSIFVVFIIINYIERCLNKNDKLWLDQKKILNNLS